ncbi:MAG: hypothetical protein ACXWAT_09810 [Methylobacter sp.]
MSKSKIKKPFRASKTSEQTILDIPNPQEKATITALLNEGRIAKEALNKSYSSHNRHVS